MSFFPRSIPSMKTALLLMAHGSRQEEANEDLRYVAAELRAGGRYAIVEASFLELARPDIEEGAALCVAQGTERVILLPYFLSAGVHFWRDLNAIHGRLTARFPEVDFRLAEPLGRHLLLLEVVLARAGEAEAFERITHHQDTKNTEKTS